MAHGFELIEEKDIPEINSHAYWFRHGNTGAQLVSIENDDENKVFTIAFRTPPSDSTGVAHILEHSVLSGSRKYPVKDPFRELNKGSLNTFLNAFTYPDKTCYPVASQNLQDFYNLVDVYVDAVLHPLIPPLALQQEGWRYEMDDLDTPLTYKGVVFNEMKGVYSSPDSLLDRYSQQALFPDHTYGVDSGGDPQVIPSLTYEQFKGFHERYYHPSNAYIFFYGDDDPAERLERMDAYLQGYTRIEPHSDIPLHPNLERSQRVEVPYDAGQGEDSDGPAETEKKGYLTANWLLPTTDDPQTVLSHQILEHILIGTPASPLRKALIDSGLGEDLAGSGLTDELRQMYFSTGLKGIALEDAGKVEALIQNTLQSLAEEGIDPDMVAASMNTVEFMLRENNTGSFPRGLSLVLRALTSWLYGGDPLSKLAFEAPLTAIKKRLEAGDRFFETLIRGSFLENPNYAVVLLKPDPDLSRRQDAQEAERLAQARAAMSGADLQSILEDNRLLNEHQETPDPPEALKTIPSLKLADLEKGIKVIPLELVDQGNTRILFHDLFTNGILYLDLGLDLHVLPQELLPYAPLFGRALLEMGTESEDYVKLSQRIGRTTGGIYPVPYTTAVHGRDQAAAWLFLRGKAIPSQANELLGILRDVLLTVKLDQQERFRQIVLEEKAGLEAQLTPAGHRMVNLRLRAQFGEASWAAEQMGGVSFLFFLRRLAEDLERDWPSVLEKLETVRRTLLNRSSIICNVTVDLDHWKEFQPHLDALLAGLPDRPATPTMWKREQDPISEGLTIPAQVNYVGKGANLYELGYDLRGSISVINNFLSNSYLYERVRLQGGAYGVFPAFDLRSGVYTFLSYRDPNLLRTVETYDQAGQFLNSLGESNLSQDEIEKNIIGTIGELDAYQLPDAKGFTSLQRYLANDTDEERQHRRDQVLSTTLPDFHSLGVALDRLKDAGRVVVLGSNEAIQAANSAQPGWLDVQKVL